MNAHKYTASTMEAALAKVKSELGRDAVILHTRCIRAGGVFGIGGRDVVEVTASNDVAIPRRRSAPAREPAQARPSPPRPSPARPASPAMAQAVAAAATVGPLERVYRQGGASDDLGAIKNDLAGVRGLIEDLVRQTRPSRWSLWPETLRHWCTHLAGSGVSDAGIVELLEPVAARLAGANADRSAVAKMVLCRIGEAVRTAPPICVGRPGAPAIVAFVGPTGVGKTTTIAKLAAHFALREHKTVGLVTLDTYRIAAVEQLRTYARIIDVPMEVVLTPAEMPQAIQRLSRAAVIFVDTAGRSQRDVMKINDLKAFFERTRPDHVHLVLSATAERCAIADTVEKFSVYNPDRVVVTKLDELPSYGKLIDIAALTPHPISYLTTGQDVPDDIETARPERIAALVAGEAGLDG